MKYIIGLIVIITLLVGCTSASKHLQNANYDAAIRKSVKKLQRKPTDVKHLGVLEQAFEKANERDHDKIVFLKKEGRPDNWDSIFKLFSQIKSRQDLVKQLSYFPPNIVFTNYDEEIIAAKKKAAEYYYTYGKKLLNSGGRKNARKAFSELKKVQNYYADFRDIEQLKKRAKNDGTTNVLFKIKNQSQTTPPQQLIDNLQSVNLNNLNKNWVKYYTTENESMTYHNTIWLTLKLIDVTPEQVKEVHFNETAKVKDGWKYVLDENGNVKKDTSGNDIKVPKTKTISCKVIQTQLRKVARLVAELDIIDTKTGELLKRESVTADAIFSNITGRAIGDLRALKPSSKALVSKRPVPFPSDGELIVQAGITAKKITKDHIFRNKHLIN